MIFSGRDLYPNMVGVVSTMDNTSPELGEQLVLTSGDDSNYPGVVTTKDKGHMLWAILGVIAVLFAFGMVK